MRGVGAEGSVRAASPHGGGRAGGAVGVASLPSSAPPAVAVVVDVTADGWRPRGTAESAERGATRALHGAQYPTRTAAGGVDKGAGHEEDRNSKRLRDGDSMGTAVLALLCQCSPQPLCRDVTRRASRCRVRAAAIVARARDALFLARDPRVGEEARTRSRSRGRERTGGHGGRTQGAASSPSPSSSPSSLALGETRLRFMCAVLCLLLVILALLALLLMLLIFGPQMYEDRMRRRLRGGGGDGDAPKDVAAENVVVAKLFDAFGVGVGGEHEQRVKLHAAMRRVELLQKQQQAQEQRHLRAAAKANCFAGECDSDVSGSSPPVELLREMLKLDLEKNNHLFQLGDTLGEAQGKAANAPAGATAESQAAAQRLERRGRQLEELSAWLSAIRAASANGEAARHGETVARRASAAASSPPSRTTPASANPSPEDEEPERERQQQQKGDGDVDAADAAIGLRHFTQFYEKLRARFSDAEVRRLLSIARGGNGVLLGAADPSPSPQARATEPDGAGRAARRDDEDNEERVPECPLTGEHVARMSLLGFARATGTGMAEHKRLRPMDEMELLKYRHRFVHEEFDSAWGIRAAAVDEQAPEAGSSPHTPAATAEAQATRRASAEAAAADMPRRLARAMHNQRVKRALYTTAPSVLNRNYYFPIQRFELFAPYSEDTVRNVDAWYTPIATELLFYLDAAQDVDVADPTAATAPRKNAYLSTKDPLLPLSLLQNELKFLSLQRQATITKHLAESNQERRFRNKVNMLENLGNLAPLFTSLAANGAVASRNNQHLRRLIRRLRHLNAAPEAEMRDDETYAEMMSRSTPQQAALLRRLDRFLFVKKQSVADERTIFVSLAAYRDVECAPTLFDMFRKAKNPFRLFAGIAEQYRGGDPSCLLDVMHFPPLPCFAPESRIAQHDRREGARQWRRQRRAAKSGFSAEDALLAELLRTNADDPAKTGAGAASLPPLLQQPGFFEALFGGGGGHGSPATASTTTATTHHRGVADALGGAGAGVTNEGRRPLRDAAAATEAISRATTNELLSRVLADPAKPFALSAKKRHLLQAEHNDHFEFLAQQRAYSLDDSFPVAQAEFTPHVAASVSGHQALTFAPPPGKVHHYRTFYSDDPRAPMVDNKGFSILTKVPATDFTQRLCFLSDNVRVRRVRADKAYGPTFGRYMAMLLYRGESMVFVIDSHNRFVPMWDSLGVNLFTKFNDEKIGLSHYPEGYRFADVNPNEARIARMNDERRKRDRLPPLDMDDAEEERQVGVQFYLESTAYLCKTFFLENFGYLRLNGIIARTPTTFHTVNHFLAPYYRPAWEEEMMKKIDPARVKQIAHDNFRMPQPWIAGGFLFTSYHQMREVPFDPHLPHIFDGEEVLFGMRMWTHGFTLFSPEQNLCFHFYTRAKAPKVWNEAKAWYTAQGQSRRRIQYLLRSHRKDRWPLLVDLKNLGYAAAPRPRVLNRTNDSVMSTTYMHRVVPMPAAETAVLVDVDRYSMGKVRETRQWYAFAGVDPVTYAIEGRFCGAN